MNDLITKIQDCKSLKDLNEVKIEIFGKKGILAVEFSKLKDIEKSEKKIFGEKLNKKKIDLQNILNKKIDFLEKIEIEKNTKLEEFDLSLYSNLNQSASIHPITKVTNKIIKYFIGLNFSIEDGPRVENEFFNFEALNLPKGHPAREMQDSFFCKDGKVLRTHTSPVQIRTMMKEKPPIRIISYGSVFRKDLDITHTPMFHQIEGLVVQEKGEISFANLKDILISFIKYMFNDVEIRFRPSFFPFTEPSAEIDISCIFCNQKGCSVCSQTGWLEILGCGLVHPNVFKSVNYTDVSGFAFGIGVERIAMLLYKIPDIRMLFSGDLRFLENFR